MRIKDPDRGEGEITNPCIRCALITSYFQELMDDNKIDDHDLILQNLAASPVLLRFEGANCFAKAVKPRVFRET
ncbi:hypothetical protein N7455_007819 [Penicillium solitum]|uniref:uncharacterized protein n=1 Tax=Penicillium solitum TaxID=60172 RepID=UPI0032C461FD|nr:hypothetical protein N7455_007819 [Penicillium solitum]